MPAMRRWAHRLRRPLRLPARWVLGTNLASRLSTSAASGQTLIGPRIFAAVEQSADAAPVGIFELKGFGRPVTAYEVRGRQ